MQNRNYVVDRNNVYVGQVIDTDDIYRYQGKDVLYKDSEGLLTAKSWQSYRSMLFVPDEDNFASDLLYASPNYPILNITDDKFCLDLNGRNIVLRGACNLGELLEYFNYGEKLNYEDIVEIRSRFFKPGFANKYSELFGFKEITAQDVTFYEDGEEISNKFRVIASRVKYQIKRTLGNRTFSGIYDSPLPSNYWRVLKARSDNSLLSVICHDCTRINAFAPHKEEGLIKRLAM